MSFLHRRGGGWLHIVGFVSLTLLTSIGLPQITNARQATPIATPGVFSCDVAPRSVADLLALLGPPPSDDEHVLEPQPLPPGVPADPATIEAITAVVRELEACFNSGDQLRLYALFSDDHFRQIPAVEEVVEEFTALETATPVPAPVGQRQLLIGPWHVERLEDGRVMAAVQFRAEDGVDYPSSTKALFFVEQDGQWLLQEMTDLLWVEGRSGPIAVADIVGPPPSG